MRLLWLLCCLLLVGCGRHYFAGEVTPAMLVGTWKMDVDEAANAFDTRRVKQATLALLPTGKFTATAFPWLNPHGALEYVTDHGTWILQKNLKQVKAGEGPRWRVALIMEEHRARADWDLFDSRDSTPALGFLYEPDGDQEEVTSRVLMLRRITPGEGAVAEPEADPLVRYQTVRNTDKGSGGG